MPLLWFDTAKKLQAIAQTGLFYSTNPYDRERYELVESLSYELIAYYSNSNIKIIQKVFSGDDGYITPKIDVRAVVFNNSKLLFVKEKIDKKWTLPGGWADIGFTPFEVAIKETQEESGLKVVPKRLLALMDKKCHKHPPSPFYSYKIFILCEIKGGKLCKGIETLDAKFFSLKSIPELSLDRITKSQLKIIKDRYLHPELGAYCE